MTKDIALRLLLPALVIAATYFGLEQSTPNPQPPLVGQAGSQTSVFSSLPFPTSPNSSEPIASAFSSEPLSTSSSTSIRSISSTTSRSSTISSTTSSISSTGSESSSSSQASIVSSSAGLGGDFGTFDGDDDEDRGGFGGTNGTIGTAGGVVGGSVGGAGGTGVSGSFCVGGICTPSIITEGIPGCNFEQGIIDARKCLPAFLAHLIRFVFGFAAGICILMIAFAGYEIVLGNLPGGSSEAGKNRLTWAIIGFIMAGTSFFIMDFIISSIGG